VVDVSALRMREATISAGIWLTYGVGGLGELYVALTWQRENRAALAVLFALAIAAGVAVSLLPRARIVRSRFREAFFLSWTFADFAMIVLGTWADGGTASPLVLVFFIPVVFSSMSYPLASVATVGVVSVFSYLTLALVSGGADPMYQAAFATALACTAAMSAWQARNHRRQHEALADASRADPLTGCLNRRGFEERAVAELSLMRREGRQGAILVLDLDHFKPVNDRFGHAAGDELLCWVVQTLGEVTRPVDAVGRLGGDEFAVLFPGTSAEDARRGAARIARALSERAPTSVGLAIFPDDGADLEELSRQADLRLYASREGRGDAARGLPRLPETGGSREPGQRGGRPPAAAFWQETLDSLSAGVAVLDVHGEVIAANAPWRALLESRYGWAVAVGHNYIDACATALEPAAARIAEGLRELCSGERLQFDFDYSLRRMAGRRWFSLRAMRHRGAGPRRVVVTLTDVSDGRQARKAYAEAVADCMGEGLFTLDVDGLLTYLNPAAEALLGWTRNELRGRVMHEVIHTVAPDGSTPSAFEACPITRALRDGATVRVEDDRFVSRSGRELPVAYTATPFATAEGVQGCVVVFQHIAERKREEADRQLEVETLACINRVEDALAQERFVLYAQPLIDLRTGETVQHELLLRMRERDGRIVAPNAFLPVAERYALVGEIDWWVIKRAAQIAAAGCPVELNISARSIGDLDVLEHIERSIGQSGADPASVVFEITETAIVEDEAAALRFAQRLHRLGCKIALDDFGTGYGGFTYLKQIPVDYLKIDIEFVRDLASNRASAHVVQAVVALARDFDLKTIAEGVEEAGTLEILRDLGVDFAQGYYIARPEPFEERPGDRARRGGSGFRRQRRPIRQPARSAGLRRQVRGRRAPD
jgi:diguanylate cyclase (GGDEF)-like protein/PAS domain S-box-containing protein